MTMTLTRQINAQKTTSTTTAASLPKLPLLLHASELPGEMCIRRLERAGILTALDERTAFLSAYAETLYGRAQIATQMVPLGSAACSTMALWVWLGGKLPDTITIFSNSHYRAPVFGRIIQVFNRQIGPRNLMRIGKLVIANPLWTACQLACLPPDEFNKAVGLSRFITFLHHFNVAPSDCAGLLNANPRWPGHAYGEKLIATLEKAGMREMKICGE